MPLPRTRPHVFSNFVTTLDGVVSLNTKGHASGGDIGGFSAQDRMVMGLCRAIADVVIIGTGTLSADRRHVWTAAAIYSELADEYRQLSETLGQRGPPLNVIVSGSGRVDLRLPVFTSGKVPALINTTSPVQSVYSSKASPLRSTFAQFVGAQTRFRRAPSSSRCAGYGPASESSSREGRDCWATLPKKLLTPDIPANSSREILYNPIVQAPK